MFPIHNVFDLFFSTQWCGGVIEIEFFVLNLNVF